MQRPCRRGGRVRCCYGRLCTFRNAAGACRRRLGRSRQHGADAACRRMGDGRRRHADGPDRRSPVAAGGDGRGGAGRRLACRPRHCPSHPDVARTLSADRRAGGGAYRPIPPAGILLPASRHPAPAARAPARRPGRDRADAAGATIGRHRPCRYVGDARDRASAAAAAAAGAVSCKADGDAGGARAVLDRRSVERVAGL